jgi:hypothetical protein
VALIYDYQIADAGWIRAGEIIHTRHIGTSHPLLLDVPLSFSQQTRYIKSLPTNQIIMATPTRIHIEPHNTAIFSSNMRADATDTLNDLLQENMENHHVYFGDAGMHGRANTRYPTTRFIPLLISQPDHIVHHLLAIYALGASPESLKEHYCRARQQQRPAIAIDESVIKALSDKATWKTCTGNHRQYQNFLAFFQRELAKKSVEDVLLEYLFKGDERADDMLVRMFSGKLSPTHHSAGRHSSSTPQPTRVGSPVYVYRNLSFMDPSWLCLGIPPALPGRGGIGPNGYPLDLVVGQGTQAS